MDARPGEQLVDGASALSPGTIVFGLNGSNALYNHLAGAGALLTLGSHLTVTGTAGQVYGGGNAFDNRGLIRADPTVLGTAAGTITLNGTGWTNHGTIQAKAGDTVTLAGTVGAAAGAADLGSVTRNGGIINFTGVLTNTGGTTLTLTTSWNLVGGTIIGGALAATTGNALVATNNAGTLNGVTLDGTGAGNSVSPLDMQSVSGQVSVQGGMTLKGSTIQLGNAAGTTSSNLVFVNGSQTVDGASALSPGTIVFGLGGSAGTTIGGAAAESASRLDAWRTGHA